ENNQDHDKQADNNDKDKEEDNSSDKQEIYWGVDSAQEANDDLYQCVKDNFGKPKVIGRYLGDVEDVSVGLDQDEVKYLHHHDMKVVVVYNHLSDATGHDQGVEHAEKAIELAKEIDMPEGVVIFGDIEPDFSIDSPFIEGWYKTLDD